MNYTSEVEAIISKDLITAKEAIVTLRNDIRYYHKDDTDSGINVVETIDELVRLINVFKKEELDK